MIGRQLRQESLTSSWRSCQRDCRANLRVSTCRPRRSMRPTCAVIQCGPAGTPTRHWPYVCVCHMRDRDCSIAAWRECAGGPKMWPRIEGGHPKFAGGAPLSNIDQSGCPRKKFAEILEDSEFVRHVWSYGAVEDDAFCCDKPPTGQTPVSTANSRRRVKIVREL